MKSLHLLQIRQKSEAKYTTEFSKFGRKKINGKDSEYSDITKGPTYTSQRRLLISGPEAWDLVLEKTFVVFMSLRRFLTIFDFYRMKKDKMVVILYPFRSEKQHFGPFWAPEKGFCGRRGLLFLYHGMKMTPKYHN